MIDFQPRLARLVQELQALESQHLRRHLQVIDAVLPDGWVRVGDRELLNLSSNDYLGLSQDERLIAAAQQAAARWGTGSTASRLIAGNYALHAEVEAQVAAFKGTARAALFNTGYMANVGIIAALMGRGDVIFSDRLNHASIIDGIRLSGAAFYRFRHRDLNHLEELLHKTAGAKNRLIITDTVFSVDGDLAPLRELVELKDRYRVWLMVDEAHATGIWGAKGAGLAEAMGVAEGVEIHMGTFSKALGSFGAYAAGEDSLIEYLYNRARSFIYSTALPPPVLGAIQASLKIVTQEPERRQGLLSQAARFREKLQAAGFNTLNSETQIIPVLAGDNRLALEFADRLRQAGIMAVAIRPPTVPPGGARIRFSLAASHAPEALDWAAQVIIQVGQELELS
ncbi:MAG: 8-amino-7-oxononanoate synthase [Deltaproteobacteria bacterium]|nr:8-amino-7-oxononanoate synthase [Deltaproteobacteria bacterium]MBW1953192.1 8-amino-7-oxononanoate synthase [Deltaproteobacteria bacterium]MBW1985984.1 8-amino-7-oxononanoate synthase [Deltaproteobacteria bacterium]MBW2134854.1 8-amino-7-oxononanoate synthase [Deltaproteobacteria bacterium]